MVDSDFHPSKVDRIVSGIPSDLVFKSNFSPHGVFIDLKQMGPVLEKGL